MTETVECAMKPPFAMNVFDFLKKSYKKHGKKAVVVFLIYFVVKWTLTIVFGAQIIAFFKDWLG